MPSLKSLFGVLAAATLLIAVPGVARAQSTSAADVHSFTLSIMGGVGGSFDEDRAGFDNPALQLGLSVVSESSVEVAARVGTLGFGSTEAVGRLFDVDLSYATLSGEYTFGEVGYQSGIFFGLGAYRLEGKRLFTGESVSTSRFGVTGGVTGEFDISDRIGFLAELSAHLLPGAEAEVFASGLVGLAIYLE